MDYHKVNPRAPQARYKLSLEKQHNRKGNFGRNQNFWSVWSRVWKVLPNHPRAFSRLDQSPVTTATWDLLAKTSLRNNKLGLRKYWSLGPCTCILADITKSREAHSRCGGISWSSPGLGIHFPQTCNQPVPVRHCWSLKADSHPCPTVWLGTMNSWYHFLFNRILIYKNADNISMEINFTLSLHWQVELQVSAM